MSTDRKKDQSEIPETSEMASRSETAPTSEVAEISERLEGVAAPDRVPAHEASPGWAAFHHQSYEAGKAVRTAAIGGAERLSEATALAASGTRDVARGLAESARKKSAELSAMVEAGAR